jgi:oxazoline/thiazoline synthase
MPADLMMRSTKKNTTEKSNTGKGGNGKNGHKSGHALPDGKHVLPDGKEVPQFSPNFSVYLLPESVCLYSENRKFFLHGELYCKLAAAIAKGGKNCRDLVRDLEHEFPSDKIQEALKRLFDRRYVVPASSASAGVAAAYWASLGLPLDTAVANLQKCRVRVQAAGVHGGAELTAALRDLGVRVVDRTPDLTVTVVGDYMESRLAQVNEQHLADQSPWLLVQPSGLVPLVGPIFTPGKGACWACLADRMFKNREIKGMLDREHARCLVASPLAKEPLGQTGLQLAAVEISKAIATGFRTELSNHIISLDLSGAAVVKHHVAARPQCPVCGRKKLRDPRRVAAPIDLGASGKLVMTSGGYRSVSSRATVARFRKHVSPLTGVVSRLERIDADLPLNTNFIAAHNFSSPARSVRQLRAGLGGGSYGKGSTAEQGEASALMEAIERYSGIFQGDEIRVVKRFTDFAPGEAILPNDVLLYSDAQFAQNHSHADTEHARADHVPLRFDPSAKVEWSPAWSLRDQCFRYLPTGILYFFYGQGFEADSNGCAAGNTVGEAIVQGFLELVERDAYAIWWYNRSRRRELDLSQFDDSYIRDLQTQLGASGRKLWVLDVTNDLGVPTFIAMTHWMQNGAENIEFGSGAHFDPRIALLRALTELNQFLAIGLMNGGTGEKSSLDYVTPLRLEDHPYLTPSDQPMVRLSSDSKFGRLDVREQVSACVNIARQQGLDFLVLDQTRPDIDVPVVRVIVPGLRHFYRRFARGRLYDVPIKLGLRDRPLPEDELNPIHPHT